MRFFLRENPPKEFIRLPAFFFRRLVPAHDSDISFFDNEPVCLLFCHHFPLCPGHLADIDEPDIIIGCLFLSVC